MKNELLSMIKKAMLSKNQLELDVLRLIKTEFMNFETAKNATVLDEAAEIKILMKMVKQRKDSIVEFQKANRLDLVEKETAEMEIIKTYLPKEVSEDEIASYVDEVLSTLNTPNIGSVIGSVKSKFPTADGSLVAKVVKSKLMK